MADRKKHRSPQQLPALSRRELVARLSDAKETLRAIRSGDVDAIVVNAGGVERFDRTDRARVLEKLGVKNSAAIVQYAIRNGLVM